MQSGSPTTQRFFPSHPDRVNDNPDIAYVVQDTDPSIDKPRNWRHFGLMAEVTDNHHFGGLSSLWVSSSAAPNKNSFDWIHQEINSLTDTKASSKIIIDLRQESHAYLNNESITHATEHNWINRNKNNHQAHIDETRWIQEIQSNPVINNVLTPEQHKARLLDEGRLVSINTVQSEKEIAEAAGFNYFRLYISDHMAPTKNEIDRFVQFIKRIPAHTWVHLHCRGGEGRTSTFLALFCMLKYAHSHSFDEIIACIASIPPYYNLAQTTRRCPELTIYYKERYGFLQQFYLFANAIKRGYQGNWSDWDLERQPSCANKIHRK